VNPKRFLALFHARNQEFIRDKSAFGWNVIFPVIIVFGFYFAFSSGPIDLYKVGSYPSAAISDKQFGDFFKMNHVKIISVANLEDAIVKIERHQLDMLFDHTKKQYWINPESPAAYIMEKLYLGSLVVTQDAQNSYSKHLQSGNEIRYVDWLVPGVMAMNIMFSALFGVGFVIVRYRKNGVLKRLKATPLTALEFLSAQVCSRLLLILAITILIYAGINYFIHFRMNGSYFDLIFVFTLGAFSLISMGLIVSARIANEEFASGLLNLLSWPMMFLSGVWFSLEGVHPYLQKLAMIFPLTHLISGARAIMIDGASLADISTHIITLVFMAILFIFIGAISFRWD